MCTPNSNDNIPTNVILFIVVEGAIPQRQQPSQLIQLPTQQQQLRRAMPESSVPVNRDWHT